MMPVYCDYPTSKIKIKTSRRHTSHEHHNFLQYALINEAPVPLDCAKCTLQAIKTMPEQLK